MFKVISTTKYLSLIAEIESLELEISELKDKSPRDLIREILKITPLDIDFDGDDERYSDPSYQKGMADLSDNTILQEELKKLRHENANHIINQTPKNEMAELIWTGGIDNCDILLNRLKGAKEFLAQTQLNKEDAAGWQVKK